VASEPTQLVLRADAGPGADDEERACFAQRLRDELLRADVDAVEPVRSSAAPQGRKGVGVSLATLAVTLAPIALTAVMNALQTWLSRYDRASVTVENGPDKIVVTGSPSKDQQRLIDAFVSRHKA